MKITQYFGFDFLRNYVGDRFFQLNNINRLNIYSAIPTAGGENQRVGWLPENIDGEWWLRGVSGTYNSTFGSNSAIRNYARQTWVSFYNAEMFAEALSDPNIMSFGFAFRFMVKNSAMNFNYQQDRVLTLTTSPSSSQDNSFNIVLPSVINTTADVSNHIEVLFDFSNRVIRRWLDGEEVSTLVMEEGVTREVFLSRYLMIGEFDYSTRSVYKWGEWAVKDFVFHVGDEHISGTPHRNIGPVKVQEVESTLVSDNGWSFEDPSATFDDFFSDLLWEPVVTPSSLLSPKTPTNIIIDSNTSTHELDKLVAVGVNVFAHRKPGEYVRPLRCTASNVDGEVFSELCNLGSRTAPLGADHKNTFIRPMDKNYDNLRLTLSLEE